jgi:hypothetical protein
MVAKGLGVRGVGSKSRDLGSDRGYRVMTIRGGCRWELGWATSKPAPFLENKRVRHPKAALDTNSLATGRSVADAAFYGGVAFAGVDDDFLFFAFLVVDD